MGVLFVSDAIQTICVSEGVWHFVVYGWGSPNAINERLRCVIFRKRLFSFVTFIFILACHSPGFNLIPVTGAITASIAQVFYAQKIWTFLHAPYNHMSVMCNYYGMVLPLRRCNSLFCMTDSLSLYSSSLVFRYEMI